MKKLILSAVCCLLMVNIGAQNMEKNFSITSYWGLEMAAYLNLDIPDIAVSFGAKRPAAFAPEVLFSYQLDIPKWSFSIGGELGGLPNEKTSIIVGGCHLFGGYRFTKALTVGLSCGMQAYRCYAALDGTASMDLEHGSIAGNPAAWDLANVQKLTVGPCVKYNVDGVTFLAGADFGLIPSEYQSQFYRIDNNKKGTFHRIYIGYQVSI